MKLEELKLGPPRVLMYGEVGSGKTAFALTVGERGFVCDFDNGLRSGLSIKDKFSEARRKVEVRQFLEENPETKATAWLAFKSFVRSLPQAIAEKRFTQKVLVIDSLTVMMDCALRFVLANHGGSLGRAPQIQEWGLSYTEVKNVLAALMALPLAIVLIAHDQFKTYRVYGEGSDTEDLLRISLAVTGKNTDKELFRFFDEIWYCRGVPIEKGGTRFVFQTNPTGSITARSRSSLPPVVDMSLGLPEVFKLMGFNLGEN